MKLKSILILTFFFLANFDESVAQKKRDIASFEIIHDTIKDIPLGFVFDFGVVKTLYNGKVFKTRGYADGKERWDEFRLFSEGGTVGEGVFYIANDIRNIKNHTAILRVYDIKESNKGDTLVLHLNYKGETLADFKPPLPEPPNDRGGRIIPIKIFGSGSSGKEGYVGENGLPGDIIDVFVKLVKDPILNTDLLKIHIKNKLGNKEGRYLVNPEGGFISVIAEGADGGPGGNGGPGVDGKDRSDQKKSGGNGSDGGTGGTGGNGGDGGIVTVYIDPSAEKYVSLIKIYNAGGRPGPGGYGGPGGAGGGGNPVGDPGNNGANGQPGLQGNPGPEPTFIFKEVEIEW